MYEIMALILKMVIYFCRQVGKPQKNQKLCFVRFIYLCRNQNDKEKSGMLQQKTPPLVLSCFEVQYYLCDQSTNLPEPENLLAVASIVPVDGVSLPVFNIYLLHATQHQFQFSLIKVLEPLKGHYFVKPFQECLCLVLDASCHPPLCH